MRLRRRESGRPVIARERRLLLANLRLLPAAISGEFEIILSRSNLASKSLMLPVSLAASNPAKA